MSPDVLAVLEPRQRLREKCASAEAKQESVMCCGQILSQIPSGNPGEILHAQAKSGGRQSPEIPTVRSATGEQLVRPANSA